ncbi:unnamed protein product [Boreogadus saida]
MACNEQVTASPHSSHSRSHASTHTSTHTHTHTQTDTHSHTPSSTLQGGNTQVSEDLARSPHTHTPLPPATTSQSSVTTVTDVLPGYAPGSRPPLWKLSAPPLN